MAAVTSSLLAVGLGISAAGTITQYQGAKKAAAANERAENAREKAMNLDAMRRKRQVIREMQVARSTALSNATAQGAAEGSGLQGGYGQIAGEGNNAISGINQNQALGAEIFAANRQAGKASTQAAFGGALTSIGGTLINQRQEISRIGASLFA